MANEFSQQDFDKLLANFMSSQPDMVYLLNMSGLYVPKDTPMKDVQIKFLKAIKDSTRFRQSVADYMTKSISENKLSFAGADNVYLNDIGDSLGIKTIDTNYASGTAAKASSGTSSNTTTSDSSSSSGGGGWFSSVFSSQNVSNILNTGLTALSTSLTSKANQTSEQNALAAKQLDIQNLQAQQQLAATQAAANAAKSKGMPGWGWALIGIGALATITIITVVIVKKGRARRAAKAAS